MEYPIPDGCYMIPDIDLRSDEEIDKDIESPLPVQNDKNIWMFWHQGYRAAPPYAQRTVRAWFRRLSKRGWHIFVVDRVRGSALNVENFLDVTDPATFPKCFVDGTIGGDFAPQHTSDLVRFPLLLKYGGVYADITLMQIGDLDRLWNQTIGNPQSPWEVLSYNAGDINERDLCNYFMCSRPGNAFFERCHRLFLAVWNEDGGRTSTVGAHKSPLLQGLPLNGEDAGLGHDEDGRWISDREAAEVLTDYIIQGHCMKQVMGLIDREGDWNGPEYCEKHVYAIDYMVGSQLINEYTAWNGPEAFRLMSLPLPKPGHAESQDQAMARKIVEGCLSKSFAFKLAGGLIIKYLGQTLGSLWKSNVGSDDVPGTYAHWLRQAMILCTQKELPPRQEWKVLPPTKEGLLLRVS